MYRRFLCWPGRPAILSGLKRPKPLKMTEPGNRVFRFRPILGQDAQSIGLSQR
jgi:hypothetical protein